MKKYVFGSMLLFLLIGAGTLYFLYRSQNATMIKRKDELKIALCNAKLPKCEQTEGEILEEAQGYRLEQTADGKKLYDFANGFSLELPMEAETDLSRSLFVTEIVEADCLIRISREYSTEADAKAYSLHYFDRFMTDETHLRENGLTQEVPLTEEDGGYWFAVGGQGTYAYLFLPTGTRLFYRVLFRWTKPVTAQEIEETVRRFRSGFSYFRSSETGRYDAVHTPQIPDGWSEETKAVYRKLQEADAPYWGIFTDRMLSEGIERTVPELERSLDYEFPIVLYYLPYGDDLPSEFMERNAGNGKLVELTVQLSGYSNEKLFGYTPQLAVCRGQEDGTIRRLAQQIRQFGRPVLFRLSNEMNSDWTNYSGVAVLEDPDIYVAVWRRFYTIFQEEGVDNAIWIFNPNDRDYPPANWNHFMNYYPGDDVVQLIGVTGYNTGTYYQKSKNETWRGFRAIYDRIWDRTKPYFSEFPWMITEFASSSIGGDKARWIRKMFSEIGRYPNIKAAVWFHFADYDPEVSETPSRPYWLDETEETLLEFKKGLEHQNGGSLLSEP